MACLGCGRDDSGRGRGAGQAQGRHLQGGWGRAARKSQLQRPAIGPGSLPWAGSDDGNHLDRLPVEAAGKVPVLLRRPGEPELVKDQHRVEGAVRAGGLCHHLL